MGYCRTRRPCAPNRKNPHQLFTPYPPLRQILYYYIEGGMGSSPSYEVQNSIAGPVGSRPRRSHPNGKESIRSSKNRQKDPQLSANPEQENQMSPAEPHQQPLPSQLETRSQKDPSKTLIDAHQAAHQQIPVQFPTKKPPTESALRDQPQEEAQNAVEYAEMAAKEMPARKANRGKAGSMPEIEEAQDRHKGRHLSRPSPHQHPTEEALGGSMAGRKHWPSEEIDYKEYDSAHIRHKAMHELRQSEHPQPLLAREPVYEHERLYPKILKGSHHQPNEHGHTPGNRHYQHERNLQEEAFEQPHKLHLYKRHLVHHQDHEILQKSMDVRAQPPQELDGSLQFTPRAKVNALEGEAKRPKGKSLHKNEEMPVQANFRKRKASMPAEADQGQRRGQTKLQELEEKSIADINKERQFDVTEYAVDPAQLVTCREGCGRKFMADRIAKHEAVCRRVFQQRRAAFDAQDHRITSREQRKLLKRSKAEDSHGRRGVPKWKAQSIALRAHIKMGMDSHYVPNEEEADMLSREHYIDIVACPVCERKFNKNAAKTHIPFCKAQLEKQLERDRFEKPKAKH